MSFDLIRQAWNTRCQSHTQKVVLAALACAANEVGECWPSVETLMQRCDLTRRAVQIQIRALKDAGLLEIKDGGGKHVSNRYILKLANSAQDTLNGKRRISYSVSDDAIQRTPCTKQRIQCAPSASISQEQPRGREKPSSPQIFPAEYKQMELDAEREIEKIKTRGLLKDEDRAQIRQLREKIVGWQKKRFETK